MFYFATESGDHVIKILICDWSVFNVVVVFVRWSCKFCLYFWLLKLFNLFSLFNMSWTDSQIESLITFYSSVLVSGARNFATGVKNWRQKPTPVFWRRFLAPVSGACVINIRNDDGIGRIMELWGRIHDFHDDGRDQLDAFNDSWYQTISFYSRLSISK